MNSASSAAVPVVETERTILRGHRLDDFEMHAAMWRDPAVTRYIGGKPFTREEAWGRYLRYAGLWAVLGYGFWAIEEKATGKLIGGAGFHDLKRDIVPSLEGIPEAGWGLASSAHGKGLATEVVRAMHVWGDGFFAGGKTVCIIDPQNSASLRVAEKCGYREVMKTTYRGDPTILFERQAGGKAA
ncbi:Protein N-acetyltransferase, RimJ/RimL family [Mesorhizobium albiziae]|uniref:Protein N-acetyltransferase, RimJ/RimL family n=1 Tax=Neomesorhizobium albiziae TaxID=335020 RepID=A0A1I3WSH1_9HYPH|nr:GNAT family N-acetyltransferase [Mesorhizobium albiziae]SFK09401.1 Protein N-acetyltransferase, RimJ/RimL family [Mesorhizobium albiziae]